MQKTGASSGSGAKDAKKDKEVTWPYFSMLTFLKEEVEIGRFGPFSGCLACLFQVRVQSKQLFNLSEVAQVEWLVRITIHPSNWHSILKVRASYLLA